MVTWCHIMLNCEKQWEREKRRSYLYKSNSRISFSKISFLWAALPLSLTCQNITKIKNGKYCFVGLLCKMSPCRFVQHSDKAVLDSIFLLFGDFLHFTLFGLGNRHFLPPCSLILQYLLVLGFIHISMGVLMYLFVVTFPIHVLLYSGLCRGWSDFILSQDLHFLYLCWMQF